MRRITWFPVGVDPLLPDGTELVLSGDPNSPFSELVGASGYGAADWAATWGTTPGVDGATLLDVSTGPGEVTWRFMLEAQTRSQFVDAYHRLVRATNPKRGMGVFRVEDAISTDRGLVRQIRALCVSGLRGDPLLARGDDTLEWPFDLVMQTPDPYWYTPDPLRATWVGKPAKNFFPFSFPLALSDSGLIEVDVLDVRGDADTWPEFDLYGPFTRLRFRIDNTDAAWEINRSVGPSEMLRLATKPNAESLTACVTTDGVTYAPAAESNAWDALSTDSWFEALRYDDSPERSRTRVIVEAADGTSGATRIELTAPEAWQTAP